jgi:hypothetical protein
MEHSEFIKLVESGINKFEAQGAYSRGDGSTSHRCYYDNGLGQCCIVGQMMPDQDTRYAADNMDETSILYLYDKSFPWTIQFTYPQIEVLGQLQEYHDCGVTMDNTVSRMRKLLETIRHG